MKTKSHSFYFIAFLLLSLLLLTLLFFSTTFFFSTKNQQANLQSLTKPTQLINYHKADTNQDFTISITELLRVLQFQNAGGYHCNSTTEDGYAPGTDTTKQTCKPHSSDYQPQDWQISNLESSRLIQFYNLAGYRSKATTEQTEDGFVPKTTNALFTPQELKYLSNIVQKSSNLNQAVNSFYTKASTKDKQTALNILNSLAKTTSNPEQQQDLTYFTEVYTALSNLDPKQAETAEVNLNTLTTKLASEGRVSVQTSTRKSKPNPPGEGCSGIPTVTFRQYTQTQPNKDPDWENVPANQGEQVDIFGAGAQQVVISGATSSCVFNDLDPKKPGKTGCSIYLEQRDKTGKLSTSTTYFKAPGVKNYFFVPQSFFNRQKLTVTCGGSNPDRKWLITTPRVCEKSFEGIMEKLNNNEHAIISENSFREWATDDGFDSCEFDPTSGECTKPYPYPFYSLIWPGISYPYNSGDKGDIIEVMNYLQTCNGTIFTDPDSVILKIKRWTDLRRPVKLLMYFGILNNNNEIIFSPSSRGYLGHSVIALSINETAGNGYNIEILDPNGPKIDNLICNRKNAIWEGSIVSVYACPTTLDGHSVYFVPQKADEFSTLMSSFTDYCRSNSQSKFCQDRDANMNGWLRGNYPNIDNPVGDGIGACTGWVDFVLKVAYLGDFSYECPKGQ